MKYLLLLFTLCLVACGGSEPAPIEPQTAEVVYIASVAKELASDVDFVRSLYQTEGIAQDKMKVFDSVDVEVVDSLDGATTIPDVIALCVVKSDSKKILISKVFLNRYKDSEFFEMLKTDLLLHEYGHCVLNKVHTIELSIMSASYADKRPYVEYFRDYNKYLGDYFK